MRTEKELEGVSLLGNQGVKYPTDYDPSLLETFENKHPENEYVVTFDCPEFTTLCPKRGSRISGIYISLTYLVKGWWKAKALSFIFSVSAIMAISMRIV